MTTAMAEQKKDVRIIVADKGGTITFDPSSNDPQQRIEHVIVLDTISCIGIYFRVDDHRAFAAHVYAYSTDREIEGQQLLQPPSEGEGRFIVKSMKLSLEREMLAQQWTHSKQQMRDSLVLIGPYMFSGQTGRKLAGG